MNSKQNILIAFILNLGFSVFEFFGGVFTGSVAIMSDAVHDMGDAASIGVSYFLEKKSRKQPDNIYTYGYLRYSVLGSIITTAILLIGSLFVIANAIERIINPAPIDYNSMIVFAVIGVAVNLAAALITRRGDSMNQRAVNLHMLEDVLGWAVVLIGAIVMYFCDLKIIDPILSVCVALYILIHAFSHLKEAVDLFLVKTPKDINADELKLHLNQIDGVSNVHHLHVWSMDGNENYATMHIVSNGNPEEIKKAVRTELEEHGIFHSTLELESKHCSEDHCRISARHSHVCHHHH